MLTTRNFLPALAHPEDGFHYRQGRLQYADGMPDFEDSEHAGRGRRESGGQGECPVGGGRWLHVRVCHERLRAEHRPSHPALHRMQIRRHQGKSRVSSTAKVLSDPSTRSLLRVDPASEAGVLVQAATALLKTVAGVRPRSR